MMELGQLPLWPGFRCFHPKKKKRAQKSSPLSILTSLSLSSYSNPLEALGHHVSGDLAVTKRHFFEIPNPHCNLDLDEYEYEDDFE